MVISQVPTVGASTTVGGLATFAGAAPGFWGMRLTRKWRDWDDRDDIKKSWFNGGHHKDHSRITNGFKLEIAKNPEQTRCGSLCLMV
jgi:hypothetical protein